MKGWILTTPETLKKLPVSPKAAEAIGLEIINVYDVDITITSQIDGTIEVCGESKPLPDFALAAFVQPKGYKPTAVLRQLESLDVLCINSSSAIAISRDKVYTSQILASRSIPVAKTLYCQRERINYEKVERLFTYPLVAKIIDGTQGQGVYLAESRDHLIQICQSVESEDILLQEYIASSKGRDVRVTTFGGEVIKVVSRVSGTDDFRSNVSLGGSAIDMEVDGEMIDLARRIYEATGIELCGVDLLFGESGYIVCELNSMPGGLERDEHRDPMRTILMAIAKRVASRPLAQWKLDNLLEQGGEPLHRKLAALSPMDRYKAVKALYPYAEQSQESTLLSIIASGRDSLYGREHGFDKITDIDSYRERQPITTWDHYAPYIDMMVEGRSDTLFSGETDSFVTTSGTTAAPKLIPESTLGKQSKGFVSMCRFDAIVAQLPSLIKSGYLLPVVLPSSSGKTASGIPTAYASGMAIGQLPQSLRERIVIPSALLKIGDSDLYSYLTMLYAIAQSDLAVIAGNNALRMVKLVEVADRNRDMLIRDIELGEISYPASGGDLEIVTELSSALSANAERAAALRAIISSGEPFTPKSYWSDLKVVTFWTSASVGLSMPELLPLLPSTTKIMDTGYGASELKVNIPNKFGRGDGVLSTSTAFYEFIPVEDEFKRAEPFLAHELAIGMEYEIIITTFAGLYRYNIGDIVICSGFDRSTPRLEFVRKRGDIANISGEKLPASALLKAVTLASDMADLDIVRLQASPCYRERYYTLFIECTGGNREIFCREIDGALCQSHWSYGNHISKGTLEPIKVVFMRSGWQDELYRVKKGGRDISESQIKLPIFVESAPESVWYE